MGLAEDLAAYLGQTLPDARGAAGALSKRLRLAREMSHDGTHPIAQAAAARRGLAANIQAATPMVRDAALGFVPVVGSAMDAEDAANAWREGDYLGAALSGASALGGPIGHGLGLMAGAIPAGIKLSKGLENTANSTRVGRVPKPLEQRSFTDDYPRAAEQYEDGRLKSSMDGVEFSAPFIAGRRRIEGADAKLEEADIEAVGSALADIREVPPSAPELRRGVGAYRRRLTPDGEERHIFISRALKDDEVSTVLAHEAGHAIDDLARDIPQKGLMGELKQVYSDLNNPFARQGGRPRDFSPLTVGYPKQDVNSELMAEAIRAYMIDPNYLKTVAPKVAARIREHVNKNPRIAKVIQFKSLAAALGGGAAAALMASPAEDDL